MPSFKRAALLLMGAVGAGAAATYLGDQHLRDRAASLEAAFQAEHATRSVVVANENLSPGQTLRAQDVALREIPLTYLPAAAIDQGTWADVAGGRLTHPVDAGKPLLPSQVQQTTEARLADLITLGDRAITIPVGGSSAIAGLLEPGDRVDLMLTLGRGDERRTLPLLGDVPIIATGDFTGHSVNAQAGMGYTDITLAVSELEAIQITHAQVIGELRPVLRNPGDDTVITAEVIDATRLLGGTTQAAEPSIAVQAVDLIIGGRQ